MSDLMNKHKKIIFRFAKIGIVITLLVVTALTLNPLMRPSANIRRYLLQITPINTSIEDVICIANSNPNWSIITVREEHGFTLQPRTFSPMRIHPAAMTREFPIVGERSVIVHLGTYHAPMRVDVTAFYAFDENGKLIEILVLKEVDMF